MTYNIDAARLWNLDGTSSTPERVCIDPNDRKGLRKKEVFHNLKLPINTSRTTLMAVVSECGDAGPTLFIFKGKQTTYRNIIVSRNIVLETYASYCSVRRLYL